VPGPSPKQNAGSPGTQTCPLDVKLNVLPLCPCTRSVAGRRGANCSFLRPARISPNSCLILRVWLWANSYRSGEPHSVRSSESTSAQCSGLAGVGRNALPWRQSRMRGRSQMPLLTRTHRNARTSPVFGLTSLLLLLRRGKFRTDLGAESP